MTVDMVATRAKAGKATLYRRWPSKAELVIDAVACMKQPPSPDSSYVPPDTGTARGPDRHGEAEGADRQQPPPEGDARPGLDALPAPGDAGGDQRHHAPPPKGAYLEIFQRAIDRGEIQAGVDVDLLASLGPAMGMFRALYYQKARPGTSCCT